MFTKKERGFTLIELMIVVAIIGILAAVAIPKFADLIDKAKEASTKGKLGSIRSAITIYYGSYEGLAPSKNASNDLVGGIVTAGENMNRIPGAEVPYISATSGGDSTSSASWDDNAATVGMLYSAKGTTSGNAAGYAYDPNSVELWIEQLGFDTAGKAIHNW